jgi:hypothetical protein
LFALGPFELFFIALAFLVVIPAWVICGKLGWASPLGLLALVPLIGLIFIIILTWEALPRAGYTRWLMLLFIVPFPLIGLAFLFWLAFSEWRGGGSGVSPAQG